MKQHYRTRVDAMKNIVGKALGNILTAILTSLIPFVINHVFKIWRKQGEKIESKSFFYWLYLDFNQVMRFVQAKDNRLGPAEHHFFLTKANPVYSDWQKVLQQDEPTWALLLEVRSNYDRRPLILTCEKGNYDFSGKFISRAEKVEICFPSEVLKDNESFIIPLATLRPLPGSILEGIQTKKDFVKIEIDLDQYIGEKFDYIGSRLIPKRLGYNDGAYNEIKNFSIFNRIHVDRNPNAETICGGGCCMPLIILLCLFVFMAFLS